MTATRHQQLLGAIEGGGTKFICAVGTAPSAWLERRAVPTTDADGTLGECLQFFRDAAARHGRIAALGIACFGPLQLRADAPDFGHLLSTPKAGWSGVDVVSPLREALGIPVAVDTDVGAAARGELSLGAGGGLSSLAYVTVGTGIGGAVAPAPGGRAMHAEMGHLPVRRDRSDLQFGGVCPFHGDCLEGLASGPAIRARWGCDLAALPGDHPGRAMIAGYIAQLAAAIALLHAPQVLVLGGGVLSDATLLPLIRAATQSLLAGYLPYLPAADSVNGFIRAPALGGDSAIAGAMLMAREAMPAAGPRG